MLYSNEVILVNTSNARYTDSNRFSDIDMSDIGSVDSIYSMDNIVRKNSLPSVKSRIFKIVDVLKVDEDSLDNMHEEKVFPNRNPLGVIIESIEDSSINIICKASDLLYMSTDIVSVRHIDSGLDNIVLSILGDMKTYSDYDDIASYFYRNGIFVERIHGFLMKSKLVDKSDSRLINQAGHMRFYLNSILSRIIKEIIRQSRQSSFTYNKCKYCEHIDNQFREVSSYHVCNNCYTNELERCDVCHVSSTLDRLIYVNQVGEGSNRSKKDIMIDAEVDKCCDTCNDRFYINCTRCQYIEYINIDNLRNLTIEERNWKLSNFQNNNKNFSRIFSKMFCNACGSLQLNSYLFNPFRGRSLPRKFSSKSEFNRFIGIESEIISHYDSTEHYREDGYIPEYFDAVEDGSLSSGGVEFRTSSPIIGNEVNRALEALEEVNRDEDNYVDESCGVHIHINAVDFQFKELKSLLIIMSRLQSIIYRTLPDDRDNHYCREITMPTRDIMSIETLPELVKKYYTMAESILTDEKYNEGRYIGTNLHARFFLGTVEFRYHEGTVYSKPIKDWIRFLNKIMKASTDLHKKPNLYNKIASNKVKSIDIVRDITGLWGAEYIEAKIENS